MRRAFKEDSAHEKPTSGTTDLTTGRPLTRILVFALPLVLGTLFQQLYSFADTVIVGRALAPTRWRRWAAPTR